MKLRSKTYRASFAESAVSNQIATQIRLLRETAGLSQADLAKKLRTRQSAVARLEDPTYGKQSIAMLQKIARVFDVVALVEFAPYSKLLRQTSDLTPQALTPLSYAHEFDEEGEPMTSVDLYFDGSLICITNYASQPTLMIQKTFESHVTPNLLAFRNHHD